MNRGFQFDGSARKNIVLSLNVDEKRKDEYQSRLQAYCCGWSTGGTIDNREYECVTNSGKASHNHQPRERVLSFSAEEVKKRHQASTIETRRPRPTAAKKMLVNNGV